MNKILNWTFGACFRTLGRFLAIFIVGVLLVFIGSKIGFKFPDWLLLNVKASTEWVDDWAQLLPNLTRVDYNDCSTTSNYGNGRPYCTKSMEMDYNVLTTGIGTRPFVSTTTAMNIGINGYVITVPTQKVKPGYLYNVNFYVCSNKNLSSATHDINMGQLATKNNYNIYAQTTSTNLPNTPGYVESDSISFNTCNKVSALIVPDMESVFLNYRITSSSTITNVYISTIAVEISEMGIYTSALEEVINNSGFATAESVTQVQDSVNQVQEEIQQTNDTITDSTSPDVSGMTDLAGYLPPGPLDSVLNLPLSILNSLNSKLSSSCIPLSLTLPFVNLPLNIPCLSIIFNQIAGLNVLWESIGVILGALIMYKYLTYLYNWVDDVTSLRHTRARLFGAKSDADNWGGVE